MTGTIRPSCVIGTAGHIDHGKTSLVKALTGIDTDRLKEEKRRGVSIDLGFAYMDFAVNGGSVRAAVVDVPGHERFIRNMLAGTTGIDLVLFVVAADDGVMPQTREHLDIVLLLGVDAGIFVITKADLAGEERINEVWADIEGLTDGTALKGSPVVAVSTLTGSGVEELKKLIGERALQGRKASASGYFRLPVDRSFSIKGFGAVVTGTVASGTIKKGDEAVTFPKGQRVRVRSIQSLYIDTDSVSVGQRAALNLSGISHSDIERGDQIVSAELLPFAGVRRMRVDCSFEFLKHTDDRRPIKERMSLKVHHLTGETLGTVRLFERKEDPKGERAVGRLILKNTLLMMRGDRFILRDTAVNATVGGGVVLMPYLLKELMPGPKGARLKMGENIDDTLLKILPATAIGFLTFPVCLMLNLREAAFREETGRVGEFTHLGDFTVHRGRLREARERVIKLVSEFHGSNPMEQGVREDFFLKGLKGIFAGAPKERAGELLRLLLDGLVGDGLLRKEGAIYRLPSHRPALEGEAGKVEAAIMGVFSRSFQPDLEELKNLPFKKPEVDKVMAYLQRSGAIVKLKEGSYISPVSLRIARQKLEEGLRSGNGIKASEFRDLLNCGRKLAIDILEYFDKERVTIRQGDVRKLR